MRPSGEYIVAAESYIWAGCIPERAPDGAAVHKCFDHAFRGVGADVRHPWRVAAAILGAVVLLELAAALSPWGAALLWAPERALGVVPTFDARPAGLAGPFPPTVASDGARVLYPTVVPVVAAFAYAQVTRHARLAFWLGLCVWSAFPVVWSLAGAARLDAATAPEALGWGAAIGAVAGLVAGPRSRGTMSRAEAAPVLAALALGALLLWPVAVYAPDFLLTGIAAYALAGAGVAWQAGMRWREHAVAAAAAAGSAFGLSLAAQLVLPDALRGGVGLAVVAVLAPLWLAAAMLGTREGKRRFTRS